MRPSTEPPSRHLHRLLPFACCAPYQWVDKGSQRQSSSIMRQWLVRLKIPYRSSTLMRKACW
jgi:hypothetical protein